MRIFKNLVEDNTYTLEDYISDWLDSYNSSLGDEYYDQENDEYFRGPSHTEQVDLDYIRKEMEPYLALEYIQQTDNIDEDELSDALDYIARNGETAYKFANTSPKSRFIDGEEEIAQSSNTLEKYVNNVLSEVLSADELRRVLADFAKNYVPELYGMNNKKILSAALEREVILRNDEFTHKYIMTRYKDIYPRRADLMKDDRGITDPVHRYIAAYISNLPIRSGITGDPEIEALYKQEIL